MDYIGAIRRLIAHAGGHVADGTLEDLAALLSLHDELDRAAQEAVDGLRAAGHTWDELGAVTGHSRQAALKKWNAKTVA